ncbi:hypothetical protein AgCh_039218 [Apium graveolens]
MAQVLTGNNHPGFNWKAVSKETKAFYFEEFKKYFIWKPELSDNVVQDAWLQNARTRYSNLCSTHGRWEKNKPRNNRIGLAVWESWGQHWNTPEFMRKSHIQKGNRNSGVDGHPSTHTGGSRSHNTHAADLAKELKRKPHPREVFKRTHFKHGKWVDKKSKLINEAIEEHLKQHSENVDDSLESQPIDELEVYIDVVGGRTKENIVYGIGSSQTLFYGSGKGHSSGACSTSQLQNGDHQMMQKKLVDMENQMKVMQEDQEQHLEAMQEHQQELKAIQLEHQERLDMLENRLAKMMQSHSFGRTNLP